MTASARLFPTADMPPIAENRGTLTGVTPDNLLIARVGGVPAQGTLLGVKVYQTDGPATHFDIRVFEAVQAPVNPLDKIYQWEAWAVVDGLFHASVNQRYATSSEERVLYLQVEPTGWTYDSVESMVSAPPGAPADGDVYIVDAAHLAAWQLEVGLGGAAANDVVTWDAGGATWTLVTPTTDDTAYLVDTTSFIVFDGANWVADTGCDYSFELEAVQE